jgi:threonine/homoserine/homoserine lactone efflux protein
MGNALLIFGVSLVVSYAGAINPGPVNLAVFRAVLQRHRLAAIGISIGCALPEIPGAYLALRGVQFFAERPNLFSSLKLAIAPVLVLIGILALRKKKAPAATPEGAETSLGQGLIKGILLAILNPALIPFWMIVLVWYADRPALRVETGLEQIGFLLGAALGACAIRLTYVFLTERYHERLLTLLHPRLLDQAFGWCFIGLGGWQAVQWWIETQA